MPHWALHPPVGFDDHHLCAGHGILGAQGIAARTACNAATETARVAAAAAGCLGIHAAVLAHEADHTDGLTEDTHQTATAEEHQHP